MATEIKMPQLGETVVEGTITRWLKQEGDTIEEDELLVEISTDKVDSEVPSSASGTIQKILVQEGDTVKVGTALAIVGEGGRRRIAARSTPMASRSASRPSRSMVARTCSEPGVTSKGVRARRPLDAAWRAMLAARLMSS